MPVPVVALEAVVKVQVHQKPLLLPDLLVPVEEAVELPVDGTQQEWRQMAAQEM